MKKNAMLKIAAVLLVAVLLTTCAISSTFAKYVSNVDAKTNMAKVAKWGVVATVTSDEEYKLFKNSPDSGVVGSSDAIVVAPGTEGSIALGANITGAPEVSGEVIVSAYVVGTGFSENYKPVKVKINNQEIPYADTYQKIDALSYKFAPNPEANQIKSFTDLTIDYKWEFETAGNDQNDTDLGDAAANSTAPTVQVFVKIDIVQTDTYSINLFFQSKF
jgi:hypothetical protein